MASLNGGVIRQAIELASFYETRLTEPLTWSFQPTFIDTFTMTTSKSVSTTPQSNPSPCTSYRPAYQILRRETSALRQHTPRPLHQRSVTSPTTHPHMDVQDIARQTMASGCPGPAPRPFSRRWNHGPNISAVRIPVSETSALLDAKHHPWGGRGRIGFQPDRPDAGGKLAVFSRLGIMAGLSPPGISSQTRQHGSTGREAEPCSSSRQTYKYQAQPRPSRTFESPTHHQLSSSLDLQQKPPPHQQKCVSPSSPSPPSSASPPPPRPPPARTPRRPLPFSPAV